MAKNRLGTGLEGHGSEGRLANVVVARGLTEHQDKIGSSLLSLLAFDGQKLALNNLCLLYTSDAADE